MKKSVIGLITITAVITLASLSHGASIVNSKHNLSVSGPGTIKAAQEKEICVFCHTPHTAAKEGPLWNRSSSAVQSYRLPSLQQSGSLVSRPANPPDGDSRLCLSCHDGTVAVGAVLNRKTKGKDKGGEIEMAGAAGGKLPPGRASNLGTDLTGSHVVSAAVNDQLLQQKNHQGLSFRYQYPMNQKIKLRPTKNAAQGGSGKGGMGIQCTTCHDPHDDSNTRFLVVPGQNDRWSSLCISCHTPTQGIHQEEGHGECSNCHKGHGEVNTSMLKAKSETLCLGCHDARQAASQPQVYRFTRRRTALGEAVVSAGSNDVQTAFNKQYRHPVTETGKFHRFGEELPEKSAGAPRHVSCRDCHDQHRTSADEPLAGAKGYSARRAPVVNKVKEYEVCYKCHADSANLPPRQKNKRQQFNLNNPSYHPIEGPGRNRRVPSLVKPLDIQSTVKCTDCHGNNDPFGARGPHGSTVEGILVKNYTTQDMQGEAPTLYALCYQCHDRSSLLANQSFKEHRRHLSQVKASCYTCHDAHGSQFYPHLINFDRRVVLPNTEGRLDYIPSIQEGRPHCYLRCHNKEHGLQDPQQKKKEGAPELPFNRGKKR